MTTTRRTFFTTFAALFAGIPFLRGREEVKFCGEKVGSEIRTWLRSTRTKERVSPFFLAGENEREWVNRNVERTVGPLMREKGVPSLYVRETRYFLKA